MEERIVLENKKKYWIAVPCINSKYGYAAVRATVDMEHWISASRRAYPTKCPHCDKKITDVPEIAAHRDYYVNMQLEKPVKIGPDNMATQYSVKVGEICNTELGALKQALRDAKDNLKVNQDDLKENEKFFAESLAEDTKIKKYIKNLEAKIGKSKR